MLMSGQHTASVGNYSLQSCCCYMAKSMGSRWGSLGYPSCILVNDIRKPPIKILRLAQVRLATLASSTERNGLRPRPDQGSRLKFQGRSSKLWPQMAQLAKKKMVWLSSSFEYQIFPRNNACGMCWICSVQGPPVQGKIPKSFTLR